MPHRKIIKNRQEPSEQTLTLLRQRQTAIDTKDFAAVTDITRQFRRQQKQDKKTHILWTIRHELDVRDRWLGLRRLKHCLLYTSPSPRDSTSS
eukprot:5403073-Prorocentrum_lima.AAC.1